MTVAMSPMTPPPHHPHSQLEVRGKKTRHQTLIRYFYSSLINSIAASSASTGRDYIVDILTILISDEQL